MGLMDKFANLSSTMSKVNLATGGKDPSQAVYAGFENMGLKVVSEDRGKGFTKMVGDYKNKGRQTTVIIDASRMMQVAGAGLMNTLLSVAGEATGLGTILGGSEWDVQWREFRIRDAMQNAAMMMIWTISLPAPAAGTVNVGKDRKVGESIGNGLFAQGDGAALEAVNKPEIKAVLEKAHFHEVSVKGDSIMAVWGPTMQDYGRVVKSADEAVTVSENVLDGLSALADAMSH